MAEETLSSNVPGVDVHPAPKEKTQSPTEAQAAKKNTGSRAGGKPASRQQKLVVHLLIGLGMTILVIAGYSFLGPGERANAATYPKVDVATNIPTGTTSQTDVVPMTENNSTANDLAALQAEMAELTRQMNEIRAQGIPVSPNSVPENTVPSMTGQGQGTMSPMQSRLNEMMTMTHGMMNAMNGMSGQAGGMSSQPGGAGHNGHH